MSAHALLRIERLNYLFGGILIIIAALTATQAQALGVVVGVVLTSANFFILRKIVFRWTAAVKAGDERGSSRIYLILPKMIGMMGAVVLIVLFLPINAIGFVVGYSIFIVSIVVGTVLDLILSPTVEPTPGDDTTSSHG